LQDAHFFYALSKTGHYRRFKHLFFSKHEKKPKPIKGLDGMYSKEKVDYH